MTFDWRDSRDLTLKFTCYRNDFAFELSSNSFRRTMGLQPALRREKLLLSSWINLNLLVRRVFPLNFRSRWCKRSIVFRGGVTRESFTLEHHSVKFSLRFYPTGRNSQPGNNAIDARVTRTLLKVYLRAVTGTFQPLSHLSHRDDWSFAQWFEFSKPTDPSSVYCGHPHAFTHHTHAYTFLCVARQDITHFKINRRRMDLFLRLIQTKQKLKLIFYLHFLIKKIKR